MGYLDDLIYGLRDVEDAGGTLKPRRSIIQFIGCTVADDSVNGRVVVTAIGSTPSGTGIPHYIGGVLQSPASLIVNADVDPAAAIQYSKLLLSNSIVNADVNSAAAIAGTKINPNFGSQTITTSGPLVLGGGTPATVGLIRLPYNGASAVTVIGVKDSGGVDRSFITYGSGDTWAIGNANQNTSIVGATCFVTGGTSSLTVGSSGFNVTAAGTSNAMNLTGTQLQLGIASTASTNNAKGTETDYLPVNVQTTTATVTTTNTIAIPNNSTLTLMAMVNAIGNSNTQGASYVRFAAFRNNAGTVTQISTTQDGGTLEDNAAWDCNITFSGTNALVQVTGAAGVTIQWSGIVTALSVIP